MECNNYNQIYSFLIIWWWWQGKHSVMHTPVSHLIHHFYDCLCYPQSPIQKHTCPHSTGKEPTFHLACSTSALFPLHFLFLLSHQFVKWKGRQSRPGLSVSKPAFANPCPFSTSFCLCWLTMHERNLESITSAMWGLMVPHVRKGRVRSHLFVSGSEWVRDWESEDVDVWVKQAHTEFWNRRLRIPFCNHPLVLICALLNQWVPASGWRNVSETQPVVFSLPNPCTARDESHIASVTADQHWARSHHEQGGW